MQKVQLHQELRKVVFGRLHHALNRPDTPGYTSFDVKKFLQYFYDFEELPDSILSHNNPFLTHFILFDEEISEF